MLETILNT